MKKYVVIAGVNGAGKSTLYQLNETFKNMPRVNNIKGKRTRIYHRVTLRKCGFCTDSKRTCKV